MATIKRIEDLEVWKLARLYSKAIRLLVRTEKFRFEFGLKDQMKNASGSIMDNIAEGFGRGGRKEFVNHLSIAKGSAEESRSQLYRCFDDGLVDEEGHKNLVTQVDIIVRKIAAFNTYLNTTNIEGQKFKDRI